MKVLQSSWLDQNRLKLHMQAWVPDTRPKAVVLLVHGLGEHIARYSSVAQTLVRAGFAVVGFDLRGHGRSEGRRGHTPNYETLLDDIGALATRAGQLHPRLPTFLYGHSLGGALAINYVMRRPSTFKGVIATAPWLRAVVQAPPLKLALAAVLNPILPTFTEKWRDGGADLSQDPGVGEAFDRDPLVHDLISARLYLSSREAGLWALEHAAEFPLPLLLMHGTEDRLTSWEASQEFARRLGKKITWRLWKGWYHELHNEPSSSRVLNLIVTWMNRQLESKPHGRGPAGQKRRGMRKSRPIRRNHA